MKTPLQTASERNGIGLGSATLLMDSKGREIAECKWPEDANAIKQACNSHASNLAKIAALTEALTAILPIVESYLSVEEGTPFQNPEEKAVAEQARAALALARE